MLFNGSEGIGHLLLGFGQLKALFFRLRDDFGLVAEDIDNVIGMLDGFRERLLQRDIGFEGLARSWAFPFRQD